MKLIAIKTGRILLYLIYTWVTIMIVLLFLGFMLQLFGANPDAGFVEWVYRSTERAMNPFRGIFEDQDLTGDSILDLSMVFAMIVYGFVALALHMAIEWVTGHLRYEERREAREEAAAAQAAAAGFVLHLTGGTGVTASAGLTPQQWGTAIDLTATGLDPLDTYTVWMQTIGGARMSAGTFQPTSNGPVRVALTTPAHLADSSVFGVTVIARPGQTGSTDILVSPLP